MLFESPGSGVEELDDGEPPWDLALAALGSPSSLELVTSGEEGCPPFAEEVGDEDDEGSLDGDLRGFELRACVSKLLVYMFVLGSSTVYICVRTAWKQDRPEANTRLRKVKAASWSSRRGRR